MNKFVMLEDAILNIDYIAGVICLKNTVKIILTNGETVELKFISNEGAKAFYQELANTITDMKFENEAREMEMNFAMLKANKQSNENASEGDDEEFVVIFKHKNNKFKELSISFPSIEMFLDYLSTFVDDYAIEDIYHNSVVGKYVIVYKDKK